MNDAPPTAWAWDPSLYAGSAGFYARGRVPYPAALIDLLVDELALDGRGRLLDLGCGPGSLTLPLAAHVEQIVGVDADEDMLSEAARQAAAIRAANAVWVHRRAEELDAGVGRFRAATLAQSFHWMDRDLVASILHELLTEYGQVAFVQATTHEGVGGAAPLPNPRPPRGRINDLLASFLGPRRRAGRGYRHLGDVSESERGRIEAGIFRAAGFTGPVRREVPGWIVHRSADDVVASVLSLSYAAPHLFGERLSQFEHELRALLKVTSPSGRFCEQMREIAVDFWHT